MRMRIRVLAAILIVSVLSMTLLLVRFRRQFEPQIRQQAQEQLVMDSPSRPPTKVQMAKPAVLPQVQKSAAGDPAFKKWIEQEAENVDQVRVDHDAKKVEYQNIIKKLTPAQTAELVRTATDPKSSAGQKILSVYLLVEGGPLTREALQSFIIAPLEDFGPPTPHTEAEMRGTQARSLKVMALEGLFSQAAQDASAQQSLSHTLANISDPYLRKYADKRSSTNAH